MKIAITVFLAVAPIALLLRWFYRRDLHPEPRGVLLKTFWQGVLITLPVLALALPLSRLVDVSAAPVLFGAYTAFVCAAIPEELFKFLVVTRYSARQAAFDEPMDGVVYGAAASLGFAALENVLYVLEGGWGSALLRAFTAVPCHACLGAILGYHVGQARCGRRPWSFAARGLLVVILLHGLYDFPLLTLQAMSVQGLLRDEGAGMVVVGANALFLTVLLIEFGWTLAIVRRLRGEQERSGATKWDRYKG